MEISFENVQQLCRICLQRGEVNLKDIQIDIEQINSNEDSEELNTKQFSITDLFQIFRNKVDILELMDELPLICCECLNDLKYCYMFYIKLHKSHIQMKQLYQEALNNVIQCVEEEHLIEEAKKEDHIVKVEAGKMEEELCVKDRKLISCLTPSQLGKEDCNIYENGKKSADNAILSEGKSSKETGKGDHFVVVVPQFVPAIFEINSRKIIDSHRPSRKLLTVECQAIEVTDLSQLQTLDNIFTDHEHENSTEPEAIYMCQYCPQAFTKFTYLKNHLQKVHICKFCIQAFKLTADLFKHIREVHTEHKCAVCNKKLSSHSNLRNHIKRVHAIKLPGEMVLLDIIRKPITRQVDDVVYLDLSKSKLLQNAHIVDKDFVI